MIQRLAIWSYKTTGSPLPLFWQTPPNPLHSVVIPEGANTDATVVLSKTWKPSLTIWTYCVAPTSPLVSGGAQLHATPGKGTPSKLRSGLGILRPAKALTELADWTTGSALSTCFLEAGTLGFSLASRSTFLSTLEGFISRRGADVSF